MKIIVATQNKNCTVILNEIQRNKPLHTHLESPAGWFGME